MTTSLPWVVTQDKDATPFGPRSHLKVHFSSTKNMPIPKDILRVFGKLCTTRSIFHPSNATNHYLVESSRVESSRHWHSSRLLPWKFSSFQNQSRGFRGMYVPGTAVLTFFANVVCLFTCVWQRKSGQIRFVVRHRWPVIG